MFTLNEAKEAIQNKPEFSLHEREFGFVIDYNVTMPDTFKGATERQTFILQNLRGTCFNKAGKIIRLAYHKFHNLNENPEYAEANFDFRAEHVVQEKLDGSMVTPLLVGNYDEWKFATRAGFTEVSAKADAFFKTLPYATFKAYKTFIESMLAVKRTPIFEFCSREQRIVIDYPEPFLALTGVRCNITGEYENVNVEGIRAARVITESGSIKELAAHVAGLVGEEGVVVKFADGRFVKIKAADYVLKHRALDGLRFEKDVLKLVLKNELDDVLPLVGEDVRERLVAYNASVLHRLNLAQEEMTEMFSHLAATPTKKEFAELVKNSPYRTGLFKMYDGKEYLLKDFVLTKCGSSTDVESVRWLIGKSYLDF